MARGGRSSWRAESAKRLPLRLGVALRLVKRVDWRNGHTCDSVRSRLCMDTWTLNSAANWSALLRPYEQWRVVGTRKTLELCKVVSHPSLSDFAFKRPHCGNRPIVPYTCSLFGSERMSRCIEQLSPCQAKWPAPVESERRGQYGRGQKRKGRLIRAFESRSPVQRRGGADALTGVRLLVEKVSCSTYPLPRRMTLAWALWLGTHTVLEYMLVQSSSATSSQPVSWLDLQTRHEAVCLIAHHAYK